MGRRLALTAALAAACPSFVFAQQYQKLRDRDPYLDASRRLHSELQQASFHYGPFYLLSRFRLSDLGYTQSADLPTGEEEGGLKLSVSAPQRLYFVPHKKTIFTVEATPGYSFFENSDGQFDWSARADAHFLFNHLYLDFYTSLDDRLRAYVSDFNRVATTRESESGVAGELKYSSRTSAVFSARFRENEFPEDRYQPGDVPQHDLELLERSERNGRLALHHKTFPRTSLFVAGELSDYEFPLAGYRDSTRTVVGAGFRYEAGRTQVNGEAGTTKLDFEDPSQLDFQGVTGSLAAIRRTGRLTTSATAERDLGFSIFEANNFYVADVYALNFAFESTRRITLRAGSTFERDSWEVPVGGVLREDTMAFTSVGFLYALRSLTTGLDVGWYERNSNVEEDIAGIRYVVHLSFTP